MALPTVRASGAWAVGTTSSVTATLPTHASGDLLVLEVHSTSSGTTISTHGVSTGGWTAGPTFPNTVGTRRGRVSFFFRAATSAAETNPAATFSLSGTSFQNRCRAHSITIGTWRNTGTLADAYEDVTTAEASDSSTLAFSGFATTGVDRLAWATIAQCDDTATGVTNNNSYTVQGANLDSVTGSDGFSSSQVKAVATASSQDVTFTFTSGGSVTTLGILLAFLPSGGSLDLSDMPIGWFPERLDDPYAGWAEWGFAPGIPLTLRDDVIVLPGPNPGSMTFSVPPVRAAAREVGFAGLPLALRDDVFPETPGPLPSSLSFALPPHLVVLSDMSFSGLPVVLREAPAPPAPGEPAVWQQWLLHRFRLGVPEPRWRRFRRPTIWRGR